MMEIRWVTRVFEEQVSVLLLAVKWKCIITQRTHFMYNPVECSGKLNGLTSICANSLILFNFILFYFVLQYFILF